ncbi:MAG: hypothetical protein CMD42_01085 [Gammaproteobacteria bacterium]|nr:hypothetical protein [Gammaproteobacteria bacterium]
MISDKEKYINLATQKRDGSFVNTPVWFAQDNANNIYFIFSAGEAGKVKRIKNFSKVKVAICNYQGNLFGEWFKAEAELIEDEVSVKLAYMRLMEKYGWQLKIVNFFSRIRGKYNQRQVIKFTLWGSD